MPSQMSAEERERNLKFILDQDQWPRWPVLFMKRRRAAGLPDCGIIQGSLETEFRADGPISLTHVEYDEGGAKPVDTTVFPTVNAMLDAGWEVD